MTVARKHRVSVVIDGKEIADWISYDIATSMLEPADAWTFVLPWSLDAWRLCRTDRPARVTIDGVVVVDGFTDARRHRSDEGTIVITGRDRMGRLVQESAPQVNYAGLSMKALIEKLAAPWFTRVTFSNARNRKVMRGNGYKARSSDRVFLASGKGTRIEPGQLRYAVIQELLEQAGAICWSSGDGRELVVGQPNYEQEIQYHFFRGEYLPGRGSNLVNIAIEDSTADRYARVVYLGAGAGTDVNYGIAPATRAGEAKNNPATADGTGRDFSAPKTLIIADRHDLASRQEAAARARREMAKRDLRARVITVTAPYHGQVVAGSELTLFATDTLCSLDDEPTETRGTFLVAGCRYRTDRRGGEVTDLELVPKGTEMIP